MDLGRSLSSSLSKITVGTPDRISIIAGAAVGFTAAWWGVEALGDWLIGREMNNKDIPVDKNVCIEATFNEKIEIMTVTNDYPQWCQLMSEQKVETQNPQFATLRIHDPRSSENINVELRMGDEWKLFPCVFDRNIDLTYAIAKVSRCKIRNQGDGYVETSLGYPVESRIVIKPEDHVILKGFLDADGLFHAKFISNYNVKKYRQIMGHKKAEKIWIWSLGICSLVALSYMYCIPDIVGKFSE